MNVTYETSHGRPAGQSLNAMLSALLGLRVRGLSVEVHDGGLVLRGRADSFHVKQLAQHTAMKVMEMPLVANEIEVESESRRQVVLASGDDGILTAGYASLTASGWDVVTARDGLECLADLRRYSPDLIVLDSSLLWGGAEGVLSLLANKLLPGVPVVLIGNPPRLPDSITPMVTTLEKPFHASALIKAVGRARGGRLVESV